jgi:trehalose 6-phosphate synthase
MQRMRRQVMEHNIYLWAASILGDLRELRLDDAERMDVRSESSASVGTREMADRETA